MEGSLRRCSGERTTLQTRSASPLFFQLSEPAGRSCAMGMSTWRAATTSPIAGLHSTAAARRPPERRGRPCRGVCLDRQLARACTPTDTLDLELCGGGCSTSAAPPPCLQAMHGRHAETAGAGTPAGGLGALRRLPPGRCRGHDEGRTWLVVRVGDADEVEAAVHEPERPGIGRAVRHPGSMTPSSPAQSRATAFVRLR